MVLVLAGRDAGRDAHSDGRTESLYEVRRRRGETDAILGRSGHAAVPDPGNQRSDGDPAGERIQVEDEVRASPTGQQLAHYGLDAEAQHGHRAAIACADLGRGGTGLGGGGEGLGGDGAGLGGGGASLSGVGVS